MEATDGEPTTLTRNRVHNTAGHKVLEGDDPGNSNPWYNHVIHCHNNMFKKRKEFESYPTRSITCSDDVWERLKTAKVKSELTWTNFLEVLLKEKFGKK